MNITPVFLAENQFKRFKKMRGDIAMELLIRIGCICQQKKTSILRFESDDDFELMFDVEDGGEFKSQLLTCNLIDDVGGGDYRILFFEEMNNQLMSNWRNGELKSKQAKAIQKKSIQSKATQQNSNELNSTEFNSSQFNSTQPAARAEAKHRASSAYSSAYDEPNRTLDPSEPEGNPRDTHGSNGVNGMFYGFNIPDEEDLEEPPF